MRFIKEEEGQAVVLVAVAMAFFLVAAIGLGVDGSQLYAHRQMAQTAADAAALSAIEDIFENTYTATGTGFSISAFNCSSTTNGETPCAYAIKNGFTGNGTTGPDTVAISFPGAPSGVTLATGFPAEVVKATVSRQVPTTLLRLVRFVAPTATTVTATATAAIVSVVAPIPIIVNHPTLTGSMSGNGNISITICGGPQTSIWVNSSNGNATSTQGSSNSVDLTHAGPPDPGDCTGTTDPGGIFGVAGGPSSPTFTITPSNGYKYEDGWIPDPLAWVTAPTNTGWPTPTKIPGIPAGTDGCTAALAPCTLYKPGIYPTGIDGGGQNNLFSPGIYYVQNGGFKCDAGCTMAMATGVANDSTTGTAWAAGHMMVYNTGSGLFTLTATGTINLVGAPSGDLNYPSILLFQDRTSVAHTGNNKNTVHTLGGNGSLTLVGTVYMTNTRATMLASASHYQQLDLQGTPGSATKIQGEVIVDALSLGGHGSLTMNLNNAAYTIAQIALVN
jgi:hypothetical protein